MFGTSAEEIQRDCEIDTVTRQLVGAGMSPWEATVEATRIVSERMRKECDVSKLPEDVRRALQRPSRYKIRYGSLRHFSLNCD